MSDIIIDSDSGKFKAGDGQDLNLYHNGTNSFIENETGILYVTNKANTSLILGTNNTTALTIDNSQDVTFAGTVFVPEYIKHDGDTDTSIRFLSDNVVLYAGNENMIDVSSSAVVINEGGGDNDFRVETSGQTHAFHIDAGNNVVNINAPLSSDTQSTPQEVLALKTVYTGSSDGAAGAGSLLTFYIPDDETNPIKGAGIAGLKENADDSSAETALAFYISQNDATLDEAMRITSSGLIKGKTDASHSSTAVDGDFSGASFYTDGGDMVMGRAFFVGQNAGGTKLLGLNNEGSGGNSCLVLHNYTDSASHTRFYHGGNVEIMDGDLKVASGHGIDFSAHGQDGGMTSELLDDYEEGTWSPQVWNNYSGGTQLGAGTAVGRYVKIGQLVHIQGYWVCDGLNGASGDTYLRNLPYVSHSTANLYGSISIGYSANFSITAGTSVSSYVNHNGSAAIGLLQYDATTGISALQASEISADGAIIFGGTYITN